MMGVPADVNARLRRLPKVDELLRDEAVRGLLDRAPRWAVVDAIRLELEVLRARLLAEERPRVAKDAGDGEPLRVDPSRLAKRLDELLCPSLRRVLNATGVVLHTNLGRAPLPTRALARIDEVARGYSNLEFQLDEGRRGSRYEHLSALLSRLTGVESALVVNNGAGAVLLVLAALAAGREVIVSRGELVEIGGSFRVPDVMRASGARLVEVGTTNRTHRRDYERAITTDTAVLLKVHRSNFALVGYTAEVSVAELSELAAARGLACVVDLGSGGLVSTTELGLAPEPLVQEAVAAGADVVTCSGDKLLGGPQAGLVLTRARYLDVLRGHPLLRALRPDKLSLAALEATLELYRDGLAQDEVPALAMLAASPSVLRARAEALRARIVVHAPWLALSIIPVRSAVGGGALPLAEPPSFAVAVTHPQLGPAALAARLRTAAPPLIARVADDRLLCDVRTLADDELDLAARAFTATTDEARP